MTPSVFDFLVTKKWEHAKSGGARLGRMPSVCNSDQDTGVGAAQCLMVIVEQPNEINVMGRFPVVKTDFTWGLRLQF